MKKALAIIAAFALLLALSACAGKTGSSTEPPAQTAPPEQTEPPVEPESGDAPEYEPTITADGLWRELEGVWVHTEPDDWQYYFINFYTENGEYVFYYGLLASGFGEIGHVTKLVETSETDCLLTVRFDAVPETEMNEARDAYETVVALNTAGAAEKTILVTLESMDSPVPFDLLGATLEEAGLNSGVYGGA